MTDKTIYGILVYDVYSCEEDNDWVFGAYKFYTNRNEAFEVAKQYNKDNIDKDIKCKEFDKPPIDSSDVEDYCRWCDYECRSHLYSVGITLLKGGY